MALAGPKKRESQRTKLSTRVNGARDEVVALVKDCSSADVGGSVGEMAS
jgi:hypothetical protein